MTKLGPYEVHPAAEAFPLIEGEEFDALVDDIKRNGLREPIRVTHDGKTLVDGRNRYRACIAAGVDVTHDRLGRHYTESMILDLIVSENVRRRHMNPGQLAMAASDLKPMYANAIKVQETERKQRAGGPVAAAKRTNGNTTLADRRESSSDKSNVTAATKAAAATGASTRGTERADRIKRLAPDLAAKVRAGTMSLDAAEKEAKARLRSHPKPEPAPKSAAVMLTLRTHEGKEVQYPKPSGKATFNETTGPGISWAAWSWNPVTGCLHGCDYCYAREIATSDRFATAYPAGFTPLFHQERLDAPTNTTIPQKHRDDPAYRRVFVCSMADLYGRWVPDDWIERVHASMLAAPHWEYLLLTKFPARYVGLQLPPSAWIGTSVDEQKRVRIAEDAFRRIEGVKVKWLSLEPLREPLEFTNLSMFDWVVIGAQTETRQPDGTVAEFAPPFEWVARIVLQAKEAGCKVHMKPNLFARPGMEPLDEYPDG